jgi:hypothetical protein
VQQPQVGGGEPFFWAKNATSGYNQHEKFSLASGDTGQSLLLNVTALYNRACSPYWSINDLGNGNVDVDASGSFYVVESRFVDDSGCSGLFRFPRSGGNVPDWVMNLSATLPQLFDVNLGFYPGSILSSLVAVDRQRSFIYIGTRCFLNGIFRFQDNGVNPPKLLNAVPFITTQQSVQKMVVDDTSGNIVVIAGLCYSYRKDAVNLVYTYSSDNGMLLAQFPLECCLRPVFGRCSDQDSSWVCGVSDLVIGPNDGYYYVTGQVYSTPSYFVKIIDMHGCVIEVIDLSASYRYSVGLSQSNSIIHFGRKFQLHDFHVFLLSIDIVD